MSSAALRTDIDLDKLNARATGTLPTKKARTKPMGMRVEMVRMTGLSSQ